MKYYLLSSSPELALDIGLNLVRGETGYIFEYNSSPQILNQSEVKSSELCFALYWYKFVANQEWYFYRTHRGLYS